MIPRYRKCPMTSVSVSVFDDPLGAVARNDVYRRADAVPRGLDPGAPGSGLLTLDSVQAALHERMLAGQPRWSFPIPTAGSPRWAKKLRQEAFLVDTALACEARLLETFPALAKVAAVDHVVVAGGAVAGALTGVRGADADIFIVGMDGADESALWRKAGEVARAITGHYASRDLYTCRTEVLQPGVLTVLVHNWRMRAPRRSDDDSDDDTDAVEDLATLAEWSDDRYCTQFVCAWEHKYQVILRAYPSTTALLHAFDVPAACAAWCGGGRFYVTELAALALGAGVNLVWPAYSSTTYARRLAKYWARGYALGLPHLDRAALPAAGRGELCLSELRLDVLCHSGNCVLGECELRSEAGHAPASDYFDDSTSLQRLANKWLARQQTRGRRFGKDVHRFMSLALENWYNHGVDYHNLRALVNGRNNWLVAASDVMAPNPGRWNQMTVGGMKWVKRHGALPEQLPYDKYAQDGRGPALVDFLKLEQVEGHQRAVERGLQSAFRSAKINLNSLRVFSLTAEEVKQFAAAAAEAHVKAALSRRALEESSALKDATSAAPCLPPAGPSLQEQFAARFKGRLLDTYLRAMAEPIQWWVVEDPGRQYTASRDPRAETPASWYGAAFAPGGTVAGAPPLQLSQRALEYVCTLNADLARVYDNSCTLCQEDIVRGAPNTITLPCGHSFHFAQSAECAGLNAWLRSHAGDETCPNCRKPAASQEGEKDPRGPVLTADEIWGPVAAEDEAADEAAHAEAFAMAEAASDDE